MKNDEKKIKTTEKNGVELTDEELSQVNAGTMWITKEEYDESGSTIVNRKCF